MTGRVNAALAACAVTLALTAPSHVSASDATLTCNRAFALERFSDGNFEAFCECDAVSTSLIRAVQRSSDFTQILSVTSDICPAVESVFSDIITATVEMPDGPNSDGRPDFELPDPPAAPPADPPGGGDLYNGW